VYWATNIKMKFVRGEALPIKWCLTGFN